MSSKVQNPASARARARRAMLKAVGARVRALRDGQAMPRRTLAEMSGVSSRFLAALESGQGNISVARLADVALALKSTPAAILASPAAEGPVGAELQVAIDALLEGRTEGELREVRAWLEARFAAPAGQIVALLGMRGAGKSTVGRRLA